MEKNVNINRQLELSLNLVALPLELSPPDINNMIDVFHLGKK